MKRFLLLLIMLTTALPAMANIEDTVKFGYAGHDGVKIHYAECGEGPLVVMIHGFPDYWYTWRHQMKALANDFHVVAIDLRGYNKSGKPKGQENYDMSILTADIAAVIHHFDAENAIVVGHDWGGAIAWQVALQYPEMVNNLIICNLPHPIGFMRELANNPEQQKNSQYARNFQQEGAHKNLTAEMLAGYAAKDEETKQKYIEAFKRSDFEAMLHYYKQNYPKEPYQEITVPLPKIQMPVLMFHGLDDKALLADALNGTWNWLEQDLTLVTIPGAGHWVHHDAADLVSNCIKSWLNR